MPMYSCKLKATVLRLNMETGPQSQASIEHMSQKGSAWRKTQVIFAICVWNLQLELGQVMLSNVFSEQIIPLNLPT